MKLKEMMGKAFESLGNSAQEQVEARRLRLETQEVKDALNRTKELLKNDIKNACGEGLEASWRLTLGAPLSALWEGTKEFGKTVSHNMSVKNPKNKKSYKDVPAAALAELFTEYGKGTLNVAKLVGHLGVALGRGTVLGGRYILGK